MTTPPTKTYSSPQAALKGEQELFLQGKISRADLIRVTEELSAQIDKTRKGGGKDAMKKLRQSGSMKDALNVDFE